MRGVEPIALARARRGEDRRGPHVRALERRGDRRHAASRAATSARSSATTLEFGRGSWKVVGRLRERRLLVSRARSGCDVRELASDAKRPVPYSGLRVRVGGRRGHGRAGAPHRRRPALRARGDARARVLREAGGVGERALLHRGRRWRCWPGSARPSARPTRCTPPCRRAARRSARCARSASRAAPILGSFLIESLVLALLGFALGAAPAPALLGRADLVSARRHRLRRADLHHQRDRAARRARAISRWRSRSRS